MKPVNVKTINQRHYSEMINQLGPIISMSHKDSDGLRWVHRLHNRGFSVTVLDIGTKPYRTLSHEMWKGEKL